MCPGTTQIKEEAIYNPENSPFTSHSSLSIVAVVNTLPLPFRATHIFTHADQAAAAAGEDSKVAIILSFALSVQTDRQKHRFAYPQ